MRTKAPDNHCKGCVWGKEYRQLKLVYCPFAQCKRQTLVTVEIKNGADRKHANKTR